MANHMTNLKKLRTERKLSQQKLAENFGITQQAIFNYENGINEPDIYMLKQFAEFFHTSVDYIVNYTEKPLPYDSVTVSEETPNSAKEMHHLILYRKLSSDTQEHLDALLEEMIPHEK